MRITPAILTSVLDQVGIVYVDSAGLLDDKPGGVFNALDDEVDWRDRLEQAARILSETPAANMETIQA